MQPEPPALEWVFFYLKGLIIGDRTHVTYTLHGEITNYDAFSDICELCMELQLENEDYSVIGPAQEVAQYFAAGNSTLSENEANYGQIEVLEDELRKYGVAYTYRHGDGGEYERGGGYWSPEEPDEHYEYTGDEPQVSRYAIDEALQEDDPISAVRRLADNAERMTGSHLPKFSIHPDVLQAAKENGLLPSPNPDGTQSYRATVKEVVEVTVSFDAFPDDDLRATAIEVATQSHPRTEKVIDQSVVEISIS